MKQFVFLCVIIMMSSAGFAQRVLQISTNAYLNADKMVKQQISYDTEGSSTYASRVYQYRGWSCPYK